MKTYFFQGNVVTNTGGAVAKRTQSVLALFVLLQNPKNEEERTVKKCFLEADIIFGRKPDKTVAVFYGTREALFSGAKKPPLGSITIQPTSVGILKPYSCSARRSEDRAARKCRKHSTICKKFGIPTETERNGRSRNPTRHDDSIGAPRRVPEGRTRRRPYWCTAAFCVGTTLSQLRNVT